MTVYALYCTLCETNYSTLSDWNEHLTNSLHQKNTRKECWQWDKPERKCCVVIHSKTNLSKSIVKSFIPYFMENITNGVSAIITDLILSSERLGIGILRLENTWVKFTGKRFYNNLVESTDNLVFICIFLVLEKELIG